MLLQAPPAPPPAVVSDTNVQFTVNARDRYGVQRPSIAPGFVVVDPATGLPLSLSLSTGTQTTSSTVNAALLSGDNVIGHVLVDNSPATQAVTGTVSLAGGAIAVSSLPSNLSFNVTNFPSVQPISGSVSVNNLPTSWSVTGTVAVSNLPTTYPVSGTVNIGNYPAVQPMVVTNPPDLTNVGGTVAVSNLPATQPVSGSVGINNYPASQTVNGTVSIGNLPSTQPVSGSVVVSNLPSSQTVNGAVSVSNQPTSLGAQLQDATGVAFGTPANPVYVDVTNGGSGVVPTGSAGSPSPYVISVQGAGGVPVPISGSISVSNQPTSLSVSGSSVSITNLPATQPVSGTLAVSNSAFGLTGNGNLAAVTSSNALRVDGSGVTQPVSLSGTLPSFASAQTFNLGSLNGAATAANQQTIQSQLSTINTTLGAPLQAGQSIGNTAFGVTGGGYSAKVTSSNALQVDASATNQPVTITNLPLTQPVSGSVSVSNLPATQPVSGTVSIGNLPATQPISGSVTVSNLPSTQPISGTVAVSTLPALAAGSNVVGSIANTGFGLTGNGNTAYVSANHAQLVDGSATTQPVSGTVAVSALPGVSVTNFPATQPISGTVSVSNLPTTQPVSGTVAVSALPALATGSNVIGAVSNSSFGLIGNGNTAYVSANHAQLVDGSATTQPITGTVSVSNQPTTLAVTNAGTFVVQNTAALPAGSNAIGSVSVSNLPATQPVSGSVSVSNQPTTLAVTNAGTFAVQNTAATPTGTNSIGTVGLNSGTNTIGAVSNTSFGLTGNGNTAYVSAAHAQLVDGSAVTQPVSGTVGLNSGSNAIGSVSVSNLPSTQTVATADSPASGTINAATIGSAYTLLVSNGQATAAFTPVGLAASGATLTLAISDDQGVTWLPIRSSVTATTPGSTTFTGADGSFTVGVSGHTRVRLAVTTAGSGTITVASNLSTAVKDVAITGVVSQGPISGAAAGAAPTTANAASVLVGKTSAANLYGWSFTQSSTAGYLAVLNVAAAPASGAALAPTECVPMAANTSVARRQSVADLYTVGLVVVDSTSCATYTPITAQVITVVVK